MIGRLLDRRLDRIIRERERRHAIDLRTELRFRWMTACERPELRLSHGIGTATGVGPGRAPLIKDITLGDDINPCRFVVELRPGQVLEDLEDVGRELSAALCVHQIRFEQLDGPFVRCTLIEDDPHAAVITAQDIAPGLITFGPDEYGEPVAFSPGELMHCAVQGQTNSGKSTFLYQVLRQLILTPGVCISGIDPTGLLWRPLPPDPWRVSGLRDLNAVVDTLSALVDEMDERLARMPADVDKLPCGEGCDDPWIFVVMEELPGTIAALESGAEAKVARRAKLAINRLAAESRKVGVRLLLASQRFEAASVAGATVRGNCPVRVSFNVENRTAIEFLHADPPPDVVAEHTHAPSGVALLSSPGRPLRRFRAPLVEYKQWCHAARSASGEHVELVSSRAAA